ncbi:hypothetical protein LCGC14_1133800 [marine sediment metagenome]|uniref:DoxX-like family protein n=2 Tax=root TaxID=1 RepID=A0A831VPX1_9FLAO|nr:hypothetical protein [Pricia sp.]HEA22396.1 hypothetical protein [Pricia antarctica]
MKNIFLRVEHKRLKWHGWVIGFILFVYSSFSLYDYVMSILLKEAYFVDSGMTEFQIEYFTNFPIWVTIAWTVSVWGLFLATIAFLLRIRIAFILFLISLIGTLLYVIYTFGLSEGLEAMGVIWPAPILITIVIAAMALYCKKFFNIKVR